MKKLTKEEFIEKAKLVHGDKYDYSKVEYIDTKTKVTIICPIHGEFQQTPNNHLNGYGCKDCGLDNISQKLSYNKEQFIAKAKNIHGDKYDYSKVEYINTHTSIDIICPIHGTFPQLPTHHLNGCGCPKCATEKVSKTKKLELNEFIERANKIHHNKYDYSKVEYVNSNTDVTIICPIHGEFTQTPYKHLIGHQCPSCANENRGKALSSNLEEFIEKSIKIHGNKYDYSKVNYIKNDVAVCIICKEHGEFWQTPLNHLQGKGCPKCNYSKLEITIENFLKENNIEFIPQHKFEWLGKQSVDFFLLEYNIAIECQGEQHFKPKSFGCLDENQVLENFKTQVGRDKRKYELCSQHNITILYYSNLHMDYPYKVYENLNELYSIILNTKKDELPKM